MLKLIHSPKLGRLIRTGEWNDLGTSTPKTVARAIDEGQYGLAKGLAGYFVPEDKALHDMFCDWIWDIFTKTAQLHGEQAVYELCRLTQETCMMKRPWKGLMKMTVAERVYLAAEVMRVHRCGTNQDGELEIIEDEKRISIKMDPCGRGGRMPRRCLPVRPSLFRGPPAGAGRLETRASAQPWNFPPSSDIYSAKSSGAGFQFSGERLVLLTGGGVFNLKMQALPGNVEHRF